MRCGDLGDDGMDGHGSVHERPLTGDPVDVRPAIGQAGSRHRGDRQSDRSTGAGPASIGLALVFCGTVDVQVQRCAYRAGAAGSGVMRGSPAPLGTHGQHALRARARSSASAEVVAAGEQRGDVAVRAHAEHDDVERLARASTRSPTAPARRRHRRRAPCRTTAGSARDMRLVRDQVLLDQGRVGAVAGLGRPSARRPA